jgi:hypothetical protein
MDKRLILCVAVLMSISALAVTRSSGQDAGPSPTAPDLVWAVRQSENWIHDVNSFYVRAESTWTNPSEAIAVRRARLQDKYPDETLDPNKWTELRPESRDRLEIAFDKEHLRYFREDPGTSLTLRVWDGKQAVSHEKYVYFSQEQYYRANQPEELFRDSFSDLSWLRTQPHSFWWWPGATDPELEFFGRPAHFKLVGRETFRGIDCHILEYVTRGRSPGTTVRWHVGVKDHQLYGIGLGHDGQIDTQHWLADYQQVVPGCWFPMKQGYAIYEPNDSGRLTLEMRRDLKVVELRVNQRLSDELFQVEIKPGVEVVERWFGETRTYTNMPSLVGKPLPPFDGIQLDCEPQVLNDRPLLLCFWDPNQRPSRHCLTQLVRQDGQLNHKRLAVAAISISSLPSSAARQGLDSQSIPFAVGEVKVDSDSIHLRWGIRALPWLIFTDAGHIVRAQGFGVDELDGKVKELLGE